MTPQHKYIIKVAPKNKVFFPGMFVKLYRKFPNDYRKRLSEMKRLGLAKPTNEYNDRMRGWIVKK